MIPALDPDVEPRPPVLRSPLFTIHVLSLLFAYASFALACVLGITYVLLFKEIKAKHLGFFYARLPSLQVLDVMNGRAIDGRLAVPDARPAGRRHLGDAGAGARPTRGRRRCRWRIRRSSSRCCRWGVYSFALFARARDRLERPPRRVAVGDRLRRSCC